MSKQQNAHSRGGIGLTGLLAVLLTVLFVGIKLTGHINWSWWWVLSPIWIPGVVALFAFLIACAIVVARDD